MIGTILLAIIALFFLITNNSKGLLVIIVISLFNDIFQLPLVGSVKHYQLIALLYSTKVVRYWINNAGYLKKLIFPILLEYYYLIVLGIIFGFLFPWRGNYDYLRSWSQLAEGRAIGQLIRFFSELSLVFLIFYWVHSKKISLSFITKSISIVLSFTVLIAVIDGLAGYPVRMSLFENARLIDGRFLGLCGEPRSFGKACSYGLLFLLVMKNWYNNKYIQIAIFMSVSGIILSLSASTYLFTIAWFIILLFYKTVKINTSLVFITIITIAIITTFYQNDEIFIVKIKIEKVIKEKQEIEEKVYTDEPDFFSKFEVFDRAALNFVYKNPQFIIIGVGPNLISIPSSPYLTSFAYSIYGVNIDSVPHTFIINLLSRSGLIGLILWLMFFIKVSKMLKKKSLLLTSLLAATFVSNLIVQMSIFYFYIGIILSITYCEKNESDA